MAGRSFKPAASYLASTAQSPKLKPARPSYARTASNSSAHSTHSTHSDDSFIFSLKALTTTTTTTNPADEHGGYLSDGASPRSHTPGRFAAAARRREWRPTPPSRQPPSAGMGPFFHLITSNAGNTTHTSLDDYPPRKQSLPIPIEAAAAAAASARDRPAYTPLSARGDLPGGYFPNHAPPLIKPYRANQPFSQSYHHQQYPAAAKSRTTHQSNLSYSSRSSSASPETEEASMSDTTPRVNPPPTATSVMREMNMKHLMQPKGKYHPSNYQLSPATPTAHNPTIGVTTVPAQMDMNKLYIPTKHNKAKREQNTGHERKPSDVKRQLHQYQRDMIVAARMTQAAGGGPSPKPKSPQLLPLGSPGPITPFELEEEQGGYIFARGPRDIGGEVEAARENDRRAENRDLDGF